MSGTARDAADVGGDNMIIEPLNLARLLRRHAHNEARIARAVDEKYPDNPYASLAMHDDAIDAGAMADAFEALGASPVDLNDLRRLRDLEVRPVTQDAAASVPSPLVALDVVDRLLAEAGYADDSSARHNLAIGRAAVVDLERAAQQPTNEQLHAAWTNAINAEGSPGWSGEARAELRRLRDLRTTWDGPDYCGLRARIDAYLGHECICRDCGLRHGSARRDGGF